MIKIDQEYDAAVSLRQRILDMIAGVEDASGVWWNDTSPNWMTERAIGEAAAGLADTLKSLGAIRVFEHAPCGSSEHTKLAKFSVISSSAYWRLVLEDGRVDAHTVKDLNLFIDGVEMQHSKPDLHFFSTQCPCQPGKKTELHTLARYHAWPHNKDSRLGVLCKCLSILGEAKSRSGPHMRRSAVREQLLQCVIHLNDAIAPVSADEHIAERAIR
jgi:hypothetical protein